MKPHYKKVAPLAVTLITFGSLAGGAKAAVVISDQTFNDVDWSTTVTLTIGSGPTHTEQQVATGGNPGSYREYTHDFSGGSGTIFVFHGYTGQTYTPSIQGAILSLDYSEDSISPDNHLIGARTALLQDGVVYSYAGSSGMDFDSDSWITQAIPGIVASNYIEGTPDFTSAGSEITFGFLRGNSTGTNNAFTAGIDNWSYTINNVPEPSSALLLGFAALGFASLRRRNN